jgi:alanine racemase
VAIEQELHLTVVSVSDAASVNRAAREAGRSAKVHFKVDTGMGRLGVSYQNAVEEILRALELSGLSPAGIYSHFATSEDPDQTYAQMQLDRFRMVLDALAGKGITFPIRHMANSGAIMTMPESHLDMVRPGIMLYGYPPRKGMSEVHPVRPVMSLVSRLAMVKAVQAGTSISYGRRYTTRSGTLIGTIPVGYADGYPRSLTNNATVLIRGRRFPLVGTVCMDHVMVDLGESSFDEGTSVILLGADGSEAITAWDIASAAGTIPYEITCLVTGRVPREYRD